MSDTPAPAPAAEPLLLSTLDVSYDYVTTMVERDAVGPLRTPGPLYRLTHVVPIARENGSTGPLMLFWEFAVPNDPPDPGKAARVKPEGVPDGSTFNPATGLWEGPGEGNAR